MPTHDRRDDRAPRAARTLLRLGLAASLCIIVAAPPARAADESLVYTFKGHADGAGPNALTVVGGALYGVTAAGGAASDSGSGGTVFKIEPQTGAETVLYTFAAGADRTDGVDPDSGLTDLAGTLYGTTNGGGTAGFGTFYKLTKAGVETVLYSFKGGNDGAYPTGRLVYLGGRFYGITISGGAGDNGTVFSVTPAGVETILYRFRGQPDGFYPDAGLLNVGGMLYGTTVYGGGSTAAACSSVGCGTVFSITPAGVETVLHAFAGPDGAWPQGALIDVAGTLYGTTTDGGASRNSYGTVFKLDPHTGAETVVYSFAGGGDGIAPVAGLVEVAGTLYGTTYLGGYAGCEGGCGTVFSVTPAGLETVLYLFHEGTSFPRVGLTNLRGTLYSVTDGGAFNAGTVYKLVP